MNIRFSNLWYYIRSSFWFLPSLMALAALVLALITTTIDGVLIDELHVHRWWIYSGGPEGARAILSAITSSMITVAGVVFSITIVLAFVSLGVMIYFIHNVSETIQAQNIIARVHGDLEKAVSRSRPSLLPASWMRPST